MKVYSQPITFVMTFLSLFVLFANATWSADKQGDAYTIDYQQSHIKFLAKSRFSDAKGVFHKWAFAGTVTSREKAAGIVKVDMSSIDTANKKRDAHLKSADFLDVEKFPFATYEILAAKNTDISLTLKGKLTLKGVTREETIHLSAEPLNNNLVYRGKHMINRAHYGIKSDSALNPITEIIEIDLQIFLVPKGK